MKLNIGTLTLVLVVVLYVVSHYILRQPWTPWHIAGTAIALPALVLFIAARLELGRSFSVQAKATELVTTGVYARVRNPIYVFGGIMIAGAIIWLQRPWWLLVFVVLVPLQMVRARKEAAVLESKFGQAYRDYKQQTWF